MSEPSSAPPALEAERLDKWLWAARFFKTRALATEAINGGKVQVDGQRVKPARTLRVGSEVRVRKGEFEITVVVQALSRQRGPAPRARLLYLETEDSRLRREALAQAKRDTGPVGVTAAGRPTKRDRRRLAHFKGEPRE